MKRRITAAVFAGFAVLSVCGCGKKETASAGTEAEESTHIEMNITQETEAEVHIDITESQAEDSSERTTDTSEEKKAEEQTGAEGAAALSPSWYGTWEVKDYQTADVYAMSQEEIDKYLSYTLSYDADSCTVNGQKAESGHFGYESETYTEASMTEDFHVNLGEWWNGIGEITGVHVTSQEDSFGGFFFAADENTLWIYKEGVFFLAKRQAESGSTEDSHAEAGRPAAERPGADAYAGEYTDNDTEKPGLKIQKNSDGTYSIQINIFRLANMDDGIGRVTDRGMEFSATAPNGKEITGRITVEDGTAIVIFDSSEWSVYSDINEYRFDKAN